MRDMSLYDATEITPCAIDFYDPDDPKKQSVEPCEPEDADMWSVYLHLKEGGVECIADCATEEDAIFVAQAIDFQQRATRTDWR